MNGMAESELDRIMGDHFTVAYDSTAGEYVIRLNPPKQVIHQSVMAPPRSIHAVADSARADYVATLADQVADLLAGLQRHESAHFHRRLHDQLRKKLEADVD